MKDYLRVKCYDYFHVNEKQTLLYRCVSSFFLAFITALWCPSLILVIFFAILVEALICCSSLHLGVQWSTLSRVGILAFGFLGWICGRALSQKPIGIHDQPN
jgi:hypothetical protein